MPSCVLDRVHERDVSAGLKSAELVLSAVRDVEKLHRVPEAQGSRVLEMDRGVQCAVSPRWSQGQEVVNDLLAEPLPVDARKKVQASDMKGAGNRVAVQERQEPHQGIVLQTSHKESQCISRVHVDWKGRVTQETPGACPGFGPGILEPQDARIRSVDLLDILQIVARNLRKATSSGGGHGHGRVPGESRFFHVRKGEGNAPTDVCPF